MNSIVPLCKTWQENKDPTDWLMSVKHDGVRCIFTPEHGARTRTGEQIHIPLNHALSHAVQVIDVELVHPEGFHKASGIVRSKRKDIEEWQDIVAVIIDMPQLPGSFLQRHQELCRLYGKPWSLYRKNNSLIHGDVVPIEQTRCTGQDHLDEFVQGVLAKNQEGVILRTVQSTWVPGRRMDTWRKLVARHEANALVLDHLPGQGRNENRMGALRCEWAEHPMDHGKPFTAQKQWNVGTGFKDQDRKCPPPIGSTITVSFKKLGEDGETPREPAYKGIA